MMVLHIDSLLLALICGHFLGDFVFQTDRIAARKSSQAQWLLYHVLIVSTVTWILLGNIKAWWIAALIFVAHLFVDSLKIWVTAKKNKSKTDAEPPENPKPYSNNHFLWFIGDQTVHIISLIALWGYIGEQLPAGPYINYWTTLWGIGYTKGLILLTGLALGVWGIRIVLKFQMTEFARELTDSVKQGLPKGGNIIGILERLLIFMFVLAGKPEGVGFLIAAKSVFRIGDLTKKGDKDHAEYIMIGTLRSFTYALAVAFLTQWLINHIQ